MDIPWDTYHQASGGWKTDRIAKVHSRIFLGSAWNVDLLTFHQLNITHAINCALDIDSSRWFLDEHPTRYICLNAEDTETFDITSAYPMFESAMNRFLADPECQNIYVHCQCGINRSAFLLTMYMCKKFGYPLDSVVKNIAIQRPCCFQNESFRKQVEEYIKNLA